MTSVYKKADTWLANVKVMCENNTPKYKSVWWYN